MSEEELQVTINSGVLEVLTDFLEEDFRAECERVLPYPRQVALSECIDRCIFVSEREMSIPNISLTIHFCFTTVTL